MKDEITIGLNGKTIASFGIELKGRTIDVEKVGSFVVSTGSDEDKDVMNIRMGCILVDEGAVKSEEKKVVPIEPMVVKPVVAEKKEPVIETPVQKQMEAISNPVPPTPTYHELPIKTRKPRGPNKPKEVAVEESVFDKPKEDIVEHAQEIVKPARVNELAKLIKMWCKADGRKIEDVTIEVLNAHGASDIIEFDSPETVKAGIEEAARGMKR